MSYQSEKTQTLLEIIVYNPYCLLFIIFPSVTLLTLGLIFNGKWRSIIMWYFRL